MRRQNIGRRRQLDLGADGERRLERRVGAVQHEAALGLDRAALHDGPLGERTIFEVDREGCPNISPSDKSLGRVDDEAECALGVVLADISDGLVEVRIRPSRASQSEVILQRLHWR